jgi:hypothetical protein
MATHQRPVLVQPEDESIRLIALTQGQVAVVDADRHKWTAQWNWYAMYHPKLGTFYAVRHEQGGGKKVYLHRALMGEPDCFVDHWNGDTLDCRISNLRKCTDAQNNRNRRPYKTNTSGCPGVTWALDKGKWQARIQVGQRRVSLGYFENKLDAITARQGAERQHYGEYAYAARQPYQHEAA